MTNRHKSQAKPEMNEPYAFTVSTNLSADVVRTLMAAYRPFRVEVNFDNGFSTSQFCDQTVYPSKDPLAKAHYFPALLHVAYRMILFKKVVFPYSLRVRF